MPPAFNLSQDQTLKFNLKTQLIITDFVEYSIFLLVTLRRLASIKHPHLSVVLLFKEHLATQSLREGRILHTLQITSSLQTNFLKLRQKPSSRNQMSALNKTPCRVITAGGFGRGSLTMTYFITGNPQYHRRIFVSRSCSGWEGVGPKRYGRQTMTGWFAAQRTARCNKHE